MSEPPGNPDLLPSLGRLVRGLSALFWGLPVALIVCFHTARADSMKSWGVLPPVLCTGWLVYGLFQLGAFQRQERVWRRALERTRFISVVLLGLSPFLYWWNRVPSSMFFLTMVALASVAGLALLAGLNSVLQRLGAILPDEGLRLEIRQFTALNLNLLVTMALLVVGSFLLVSLPTSDLPLWLFRLRILVERASLWFLIPLVLLPLAMTMALLWKTKEVVLDGVFGRK